MGITISNIRVEGMDVHLSIEGTNSNGHGEERNENMNMEETIKNLQKDVQKHKDDNERIMKSKEQQDDFNMKLLQILNIIEKKLDKESGSRKSGSHKAHDEKMNMVETIKNLQKYFQIHKDDNENLMKAKEQHEDFNLKLMQNLDIIEKKIGKWLKKIRKSQFF